LFHICPSALIKRMLSIVHVCDCFTPELIRLHLLFVNSTSRGRIAARIPQSCAETA
jgi:hypothetical protein